MKPDTKRLHSLDALRGVAALSVVFWHWQHFFAIRGYWIHGWKRDMQPLYWMFKPLYDHGWAAVDLFFPLSGFIFFWLYGAAIQEKVLGAAEFALLRASRLYPLHTLTLLIAATLQLLFFSRTGHWFIYSANDWRHFASSLVMAQQWLPPTLDQSFNGPAWSVSIEVLLYAVFFGALRAGFGSWRVALAIAASSIPLIFWNEMIARGLMGFFVGGAVYRLSEWARQHAQARLIAQILGLAAIATWVLIVFECYLGPLHAVLAKATGHVWDEDSAGWIFRLAFTFIASPLTILALALDEQILGGRYRGLSFLGDISYSTYLIHIPMQMTLALFALQLGIRPMAFMSPWVMLGFFAVLIALGTLSFRYFERPMQRWMRGLDQARTAEAKKA